MEFTKGEESDCSSRIKTKVSTFNFGKYSKHQIIIFSVLALTNLLANIAYSIQAPIFPKEAQERNASATEFGTVFGIYAIVQFIASPIIGTFASKFGTLSVFTFGILSAGLSTIAFGFLEFLSNGWWFVRGALGLRIVEAVGASAISVSIYTFIATEFPDSVAITMGTMESLVGFAYTLGPFLGSALYEIGGFILPFNVLGGCLFCAGILVFFVLRKSSKAEDKTKGKDAGGMLSLLREVPSINLYMLSVLIGGINMGFLEALLAVHIEQFNLTQVIVGLFFLLHSLSNALTAPLFSRLCEIIKIPELVPLSAAILFGVGFAFIGPVEFVPLAPSIPLTLASLVLMGFGVACFLSSGFILSLQASQNSGFTDTQKISGQISGLWIASISLGSFIGPIVAGVLFDNFGFPMSCLFMTGLDVIQAAIMCIFIVFKANQTHPNKSGYEKLG